MTSIGYPFKSNSNERDCLFQDSVGRRYNDVKRSFGPPQSGHSRWSAAGGLGAGGRIGIVVTVGYAGLACGNGMPSEAEPEARIVEALLAEDSSSEAPLLHVKKPPSDGSEREFSCREGVGARELTAGWHAESIGTRSTLSAAIRNITDRAIRATPVLMGRSPHVGAVSRNLDTVVVEPGQEFTVAIPLHDLPIQSTGVASAIQLGVLWDKGDGTRMISPETVSDLLFVRFAFQGSSDGVVTTAEDEGALQGDRGHQRPTDLRYYDATTDEVVVVGQEALANLPAITSVSAPAPEDKQP